jgi:hypothetical protein
MPSDYWKVRKKYPDSVTNPQSWRITSSHDPRMEISGNLKGLTNMDNVFSFAEGNDMGRINVYTTAKYRSTSIQLDHSLCSHNGYMMSKNDWKNIEATIYINPSSMSSDDSFFIAARGGKHQGNANCEGFAYMGIVDYDGTLRFAKEQYHENVNYLDIEENNTLGSINDIWTGIKFCVYNMNDDKEDPSVKLELWIDPNSNNNWIPAFSYKDSKGWGDMGLFCNGLSTDQKGTWGGPIVIFGWDKCDSVQFKWMSVREIDPYIVFNEGGANILEQMNKGGVTRRTGSRRPLLKTLAGVNPLNV